MFGAHCEILMESMNKLGRSILLFAFLSTVGKVNCKSSAWTSHMLSQAGRLQLIILVVQLVSFGPCYFVLSFGASLPIFFVARYFDALGFGPFFYSYSLASSAIGVD